MTLLKMAGGHTDKADALRESVAACMAYAGRRGVAYPIAPTYRKGVRPGPGVGYVKHLTAVEKSKVDGLYYFEITPEMERPSPRPTERVDGVDVPVVRDGVMLEETDFREVQLDADAVEVSR